MNEEERRKALCCSKEELIEWLEEMYLDDKTQKEIIRQYEESYHASVERKQDQWYDPKTLEYTVKCYTRVKTKDFEYIRNWS